MILLLELVPGEVGLSVEQDLNYFLWSNGIGSRAKGGGCGMDSATKLMRKGVAAWQRSGEGGEKEEDDLT